MNFNPDFVDYWSRRGGLSHIVVNIDDIDNYGDTATLCGIVVNVADEWPSEVFCQECIDAYFEEEA